MARKISQDVYIFLASYIRIKIRGRNSILGKKLFKMQDKDIVTRLKLLYYTKNFFIVILNNLYTSIGLVNRAKYQAINIVSDNNNMSNIE